MNGSHREMTDVCTCLRRNASSRLGDILACLPFLGAVRGPSLERDKRDGFGGGPSRSHAWENQVFTRDDALAVLNCGVVNISRS